jgi:dihydropteroate synthase
MTEILLPGGRHLRIGETPSVMGIVNVTPDSFSDGGVHFDPDQAVASALRMASDGAAIVDVGGESTRPGSSPVSVDEELDRVLPVIRGIRRESDVIISVDTSKAAVAVAAVEAGASIINDVTALRDPAMAEVAARLGAAVILMHMRGEPRTMQQTIQFEDVVGEVRNELRASRDLALAAGVRPSSILVDPGIGFGKTFEQNHELLRRAAELNELGPVVIGASRKGFIGALTGQPAGAARTAGSLAAVAAAALSGVAIVRVHDVRETVDFLKVFAVTCGRRT